MNRQAHVNPPPQSGPEAGPESACFDQAILRVPLQLHSPRPLAAGEQPLCAGVPFPRGQLRDPNRLLLRDAEGRRLAWQQRVLARWPDGSVQWLLVEFLSPAAGAGTCEVRLETDAGREAGESAPEVSLPPCDGRELDTGAARWRIGENQIRIGVARGGSPTAAEMSLQPRLISRRGRARAAIVEHTETILQGPVRSSLSIRGGFEHSGLRFQARLCCFAGTGLARLTFALHNPRRARHRGGLWDLGDSGSCLFRGLHLWLGWPAVSQYRGRLEPRMPYAPFAADGWSVRQASSGGPQWNSLNHVDRHGDVPLAHRGYRFRSGATERSGDRASPVIVAESPSANLAVSLPEFWQQFPKALAGDAEGLTISLFPEDDLLLHELQGGERKTHTVWLLVSPPGTDLTGNLDWTHEPAAVCAAPEWYAASGAIPFLQPAAADADSRLRDEAQTAIRGDRSLLAKREAIDEYGWRHYGDLWADHEDEYYPGPKPVISHFNNQYDVVYGGILQLLRTGDVRWWEVVAPLARHMMDIDLYHTQRDKVAYNGGLFWHTDHYRQAATATHRSYSAANGSGRNYGGGPSDEHNYATGLLHYYYLTGDPDAHEAVLQLAQWVIDMDDGARTVFRFFDSGPSGLASSTADRDYHGPGRGAGNSVNVLLDAYLLTSQTQYRDKAEELIRRCIHPADDLAARNLLDAERRWSYTVFLTALARYLAIRGEEQGSERMVAYARASLLHYARWMAEHERPYLAHSEQLEYVTSTWAAQDLRKANVLRLAATYAEEELVPRLLSQADGISARAWADLARFGSPHTLRVLALLMVEGTKDAYFRTHGVPRGSGTAAPSGADTPLDFGTPQPFLSQRTRVLMQLRTPGGLLRSCGRVLGSWKWW